MRTGYKAALFGGAIFCAGIAEAGNTYRIEGPSEVATGSSYYNWDFGNGLGDLKNALDDVYYFSHAYATEDTRITQSSFDYLGCCETVQRADCIVSPWWPDSAMTAFEARVASFHFLTDGQDLLLFNDDSNHDYIAAYLGIPTIDGAASSTFNGTTFPFDGPFGTTTSVQTGSTVGHLDLATVLGTGGQVLALNGAGQVMAAFWDDDAFAPGAGRMIIVTDVNTVTPIFTGAEYFPLNDNGRFGLNLIAGLIGADPCNPADCNRDGILNFDDIDCFVDNFLGGCP